ncbi:MAG: EAL domain-containing protein [Chromatiales bacterium]|nr:EAL domain-containing protein [Chromatiales bacterium]
MEEIEKDIKGEPILLSIADRQALEAVREVLNLAGYRNLRVVETGFEAVEVLRSEPFRALLTDIVLPGLDGWRLIRLVRSGMFASDRNLPIVMVSRSHSERIAEATAKEYGVNRFLSFERYRALPRVLGELLKQPARPPDRTRLLVVEDDPDTRTLIQRILGGRFDIETAEDGHQGLAAWRRGRHPLVLLDVMLPGVSGPEILTQILRTRPSQSVVMMTADATPERAAELVLAGAADFIAKPFRAEQLRRVCDIAARRDDYLVSNRQLAERMNALRREKEKALVTLESIADGVITTDTHGVIQSMNPAAERLTGWSATDALGRPLDSVLQVLYDDQDCQSSLERCLRSQCVVTPVPHARLLDRHGNEMAIEDSASPIRDRDGNLVGVVVVLHDVTENRLLTRKLSHQASHDSLTGLINRAQFERTLDRLIEDSRDSDHEHVLLYLDLDQFKVVNDTCGHLAGDKLLQQVSLMLKDKLRKRDTLARLGGDEFGVLLGYCPLDEARNVADSLREAIHDFRFVWGDKLFTIGVSIGAMLIDRNTAGVEEALRTADSACYVAKESGRNRVHIHRPDDEALAERHGEMQWVSELTRALEEGGLRLYYQEIVPVDPQHDGPGHFEILIRLLSSDQQVISPGCFFPALERYSMAPAIDRWVLKTALQWLAEHGQRFPQGSIWSINLSGRSLADEHFLEFATDLLTRTEVPPTCLCFEVTETAAITHLAKAAQFMHQIKSLGCLFALDDFGSGMSSFGYLKTLPVDILKVDGVFIRDIVDDPIDRAMVRSINEIGHIMGLKTIAEYVESDAVMEELHRIGIDYAQGYAVHMPQPLDATAAPRVSSATKSEYRQAL